MAYLDHQEAFDRFKDGVVKGLESSFPLVGKDRTLLLSDITVDSSARSAEDLHGQYKAKVSGQTYAAPVHGIVTLQNKITGQVIDKRKVLLAEIPVLTKRYSYIVDGQEYQVDNQWRLKPGVYTRRKNNGELEAQFNVQGSSNFNMVFDPAKKEFSLEYNKSKIPLYPLLSAFGTSDEELKKSWGADILAANKAARGAATALEKFFKADTGKQPTSPEEALAQLRTRFAAAKMDPKVNERHLGVATENLNGQTLHLASSRILAVHGGAAEDDRDSLLNKDLYSIGDYAAEKLKASMRVLKTKVDRRLNQSDSVRGILKFDSLNQPIKEVFRTQLARSASQVNPLEMLSGHLQTTIMGPGGIRSDQAVTDAAKMVNSSHFGYLDPVNTPESGAGITLRLPLGVKKVGKQPMLPLYSLRTGKIEYVDPQTMVSKKVVLPDQVEWVDGKPRPLHGKVAVFGDDNRKESMALGDADYVMRHASQAFTATPNILPFVGNNSGPRVQYASKHVEQAISLRDREAPLVQTKTGVGEGTFHELFGHQAAHTAPAAGTVTKVTSSDIHVRDAKGVDHKVPLYDHFPLNDAKGVLHSEPVVKVGDKVRSGQLLADVNFTKGGALALGTHLRAAYMPYKGLNFEDAAVISASAAKKLTSVHLHKPTIQVEDDFVFNTRKFRIEHPSAFKPEQFEKLDADGVVKVGQVVHPGDPLIVAMRPFDLKDRAGISAVRKSLSGAHTDASLRWHGETAGTVMGVHKAGKFWKVHVKTLEPMQVGDKISVGGAGAKGIVSEILPDDQMPKNKDGQHAEVLLNTFGVGGRMNPGQLYELLAGKIAQKTGKTYKMENFSGTTVDWHERLGKELKEHGLSDTEELTDPKTGKSFGQVLFGPSYVHKLVHQADKKLSARAGMTLPGLGVEEGYDRELQPTSGGHEGGQSIGALGIYALLAHGATSFLRESQTIKSEGPDPQPNAGKAWPSQHREVWSAIQTGRPFPMPKTTFAFQKFISMMKAAGINVEKKGHEFIASPLTDKQVLALSAGAVKDAGRVVTAKLGKDGLPIPLKGGIFDEQVTGGHGGTRFSHIPLAEPMPNPVYEPAIKSLLGLTGPQYEAIIYGDQGVHPHTGQLVAASEGISGGAGIKHLLSRIDVAKQLAETKTRLKSASTANVDKLLKQAKYLAALQELKMKPEEAYVLHNLPVLPPVMRPISILPSGDINTADMNELYKAFGQINQKLGDPLLSKSLSDQKKAFMRKDLYGSLSALLGVGVPYADQQHKGLLHQLGGASPKTSYVQDKLVSRRQDLSMRGVITPEPALGLDEVSLPRMSALTLFRPFLVHQLQVQGTSPNPLEAQKLLAEVHKGKDNPQVWKALDTVLETRPVLLKRDPVLHKYGIQGFKAKVHEGNTIKIHPLVCSGLNADFDGNCYIGSTKVVVRVKASAPCVPAGDSLSLLSGRTDAALKELPMKFGPATRVITRDKDGLILQVPLEDMPRTDRPPVKDRNGADVYEVPAGLEVWSYSHEKNAPVFCAITHLTIEKRCDVTKVTTRHFEVTASTNESLCVYNHDTGEVEDCEPQKAIGKLCPVTRRIPVECPSVGAEDFEIGWMLGAFVSDGSINKWTISYSKVNDDHQSRMLGAVQLVDPDAYCNLYQDEHDGEHGIVGTSRKGHITFKNEVLRTWLRSTIADADEGPAGRKCLRKKLPHGFLSYSETMRLGLLAGLLDGDGSVSEAASGKFTAQLATSSALLVEDVKLLAQSLGLRTYVSSYDPKAGRLQTSTAYIVGFSIIDVRKLPIAVSHLCHEEKSRTLVKLITMDRVMKDDHDVVPVPRAIIEAVTKKSGPLNGEGPLFRSLVNTKSNRRAGVYISRSSAKELLAALDGTNLPGLPAWRALVAAEDVGWDVVVEQSPCGKETVYDLVVPETKVFSVEGGLVVWDTMAVYVPVTPEAVADARKMMPSNNLFSEATGKIMYQPSNEAAMGLFRTTMVGETTIRTKFDSPKAVLEQLDKGAIKHTDQVILNGKRTTAGRVLLSERLPAEYHERALHDFSFQLNKGGIEKLYTELGTKHRHEFGQWADKIKDLGYGAATGIVRSSTLAGPVSIGAHTLSLKDIAPAKRLRDAVFDAAKKQEASIRADSSVPAGDKDRRVVDTWIRADEQVKTQYQAGTNEHTNNLALLWKSGVKPGWAQLKQITLSPTLVMDSRNKVIPTAITKSYTEGLDLAGYWTQMHGARRGAVMKTMEVREPGYLSKLLQNTSMDIQVTKEDCGTTAGVAMSLQEPDVSGRYLQAEYKGSGFSLPAGTLLTPSLVTKIRTADKGARLLVRSPLKCSLPHGLCQKCAGLGAMDQVHPLGTNVGVISAHALGERAVQLPLKSFHTGGSVGGDAKGVNAFVRFQQLTEMPKKIPNAASLAMTSGTVEAVTEDRTGVRVRIGGVEHFVGKDATGMALHKPLPDTAGRAQYKQWGGIAVGTKVEAGDHLSDPNRTNVNPHDFYAATKSIDKTRNFMVDEIHGLYSEEGLRRRNIETVVRAMTNLTEVHDPGDHGSAMRGERFPLSYVQHLNATELKGKNPIVHTPVLAGVDMLPLEMRSDWMAKLNHQRLSQTLQDAGALAQRSNVHGSHPVPPLMYGAEFGLPSTSARGKPGYEHLKNVPGHNY